MNKQVLEKMWRKGNPRALLVGMQIGAPTGKAAWSYLNKLKWNCLMTQ